MCNGQSSRVSQGGSIAVLRPALQQADSDAEIRVLFSNSAAIDQTGTQVQFHGLDPIGPISTNAHRLVIHRDGNLEARNTQSLSSVDPFFSFPLSDPHQDSMINLTRKLDLGVGETGIIGRRISLMAGSRKGERVVAEGIIGWN